MKTVKQSFTLVEILVVIVIIGILSSFIFFTINDSVEKANIAKSKMFSESIRNNLLLNLVSEWKLDGNTNDSWGSSNGTWNGASSGTITSEAYLSESQCISGQCMDFDGTDDYIDIADTDSLTFSAGFTVSAWVKATSATRNERIVYHYGGIVTDGYNLMKSGEHWIFVIYLEGEKPIYSDDAPGTEWTHVVANRSDAGLMSIYINSILQTDHDTFLGTINSSNPLRIGSDNGSTVRIDGLIDEVQLYNASISESEIRQNYLSGLSSLYAKGLITKEDYQGRISSIK
jgi:prepilin-type N-terminal cleavage/methylation domain-containing protein